MILEEAIRLWAEEFDLPADEMLGYALEDDIGGEGTGWPGGSIWACEGRMLHALIRATGCRDVLEFGTGHGCSAAHIAMALQLNGGGQLISVDKPGSIDTPYIPAFLAGYVELVTADGLEWIARCEDQFDLVFEDGPHTAEFTNIAVGRSLSRLRPGGFVVVHDVFGPHGNKVWPGLRAALPDAKRILVEPSHCGLGYWRKPI